MQGKSGGIVLDVAHVEAEYQKYSIDELGGDRVERGAGGEAVTYVFTFPWVLNMVICPLAGCPEVVHITGRIREHFM